MPAAAESLVLVASVMWVVAVVVAAWQPLVGCAVAVCQLGGSGVHHPVTVVGCCSFSGGGGCG